jgi:AcrR family transcriptional regulator
MNADQNRSTEEKIIDVTIDCIEKYGISGATNRKIAEAAEVNIAAINYYFRSKDNLIQRVMEITLNNAFDLSDLPSMEGASPQERCSEIFLGILQGGLNYPNITRAHFFSLLTEGRSEKILDDHLARFLDETANDLIQRGLTIPLAECRLILLQLFFTITMAVLGSPLVEQAGLNLTHEDACRLFVTRLVDRLLV